MDNFSQMKKALESGKAVVKIIAPHGGKVKSQSGVELEVDASIATTESVLYDAVYVPGGKKSVDSITKNAKFIKFFNEALKHCKALAVDDEGEEFFNETFAREFKEDKAICINLEPKDFVQAIANHRNWQRMDKVDSIPV